MNETYYFSESGGDADRLPDGNTLGIFGNKALVQGKPDPVIFTEVSPEGEIVWQLQVCGGNGTYYWAHRVERFYEEPQVRVDAQQVNVNQHTLSVNLSIYDSVKHMFTTTGEIRLIVNGDEVYQDSLTFQSQWIATERAISFDALPGSVSCIEIQVENADGLIASVLIYGQLPGTTRTLSPVFLAIAGIMVAIPVVALVMIRKDVLRRAA
jgi:hypothetical protein